MNILMVYPRYPVTFWSFKYILKYISKKATFPPLGLMTVAAMLPDDWNVRLIDLNVKKVKERDLEWADYVMISAMLVQKESVHEILHRCQHLGKKVIAGGPLFNSTPEEYIHLVDHLILNEAEHTLPPFLTDLKNGNPKKVYRSPDFPTLTLTPFPRWDLINVKNYASLMIQYSRGCPFNCDFCDVTAMFGHNPRLKSIDQFLGELQAIYDTGWRGGVFIVDDNFIGNKKAIKKMLPQVINWMKAHHHPFVFLTEASINIADDDKLIDLMVEAGFESVFIGIETPDEDSLKECSKHQNCGLDIGAAIKKLQAKGLQVSGGYIVGFDNDNESIFTRQIKFIQETGVVTAMVGLLNALPNTRLWQRLKEEHRLDSSSSGNNTDGSINFIPRMDREKLIEGYRRIVRTIYSPRHYYQRVCKFLEHYKPCRKRRRIEYVQIKAFLKSIFYLGILGNGASQWYYWKMLFKSMTFYRKSFPEAMTLMVYGHHFRKIAKKI
ncbi:MAG: B12-binding domain-containing radical SAM protein [Syntrophales bacterium]|nr:B12-binding domain-containing radical SAM protein [Syntrophales bacterium]